MAGVAAVSSPIHAGNSRHATGYCRPARGFAALSTPTYRHYCTKAATLLAVFEEPPDDVSHTVDPMPRPSLLSQMRQKAFDICEAHLLKCFSCCVFEKLGELTLRSDDRSFCQTSLFCHVSEVCVELGLMRVGGRLGSRNRRPKRSQQQVTSRNSLSVPSGPFVIVFK